jgi:UDP-N-acetylmuramyl pentapeptide phosphotransferase/UDP-N-acetylglucosamine-1-phosphate transferase
LGARQDTGVLEVTDVVWGDAYLVAFWVRLNLFKGGLEFLDIPVTMLWIVGVTSAFNGTDNIDGLASGIATIVVGVFFVIAVQVYLPVSTENPLSWFGMLAIALVGANLGFLVYNFNPAKIFMGTRGVFFLGLRWRRWG